LALLAGTSCLPAAAATDLSAYLVLTTDYVWRGVTQSDGDPAAQLGAEVTFGNGIHVGLWGSTVDIDNGANRQRDTEVIYYAGYEELVVSANFRDRTWFEYAYSPDLYNTGADSHNAEIYTEWPAGKHLVVGAGAGYYDVSDVVGTGYGYWELGVTWPIGRFDLDFRYYDTNRSVPIISSNDRAASRVALTVRISF
jgi:hypothetical protein